MLKARMTEKMIRYYNGDIKRIAHFLKVCSYTRMIAVLEQVDPKTLDILELTAIVHDIACPLCDRKYGCVAGYLQERESPALLEQFLEEFELDSDVKGRIIFLVSHHHSYTHISGIDHQILIEADFLVKAEKLTDKKASIKAFRDNIFKTESGKKLIDSVFLGGIAAE